MPTLAPFQFTTADITLTGAVDGVNTVYAFQPFRSTVLYTTPPGMTGALLFRNGLLQDEYLDYAAGPGYFAMSQESVTDTMTAEVWQGGGPTRLRPSGDGLTFTADNQHLRLSPLTPTLSSNAGFMLFRNGQLLTYGGADYTLVGPWITLQAEQQILPGDTILALIGMGGTACTTYDGSITGTIDGSNATFTLPAFNRLLLFRNGQQLTRGQDFLIQNATQVLLLGAEIPISGDTLTAQIYSIGGPVQITTADGSMVYSVASEALLFRNGLLMTQPEDGITRGNTAILSGFQTPQPTDVVTLRTWTVNVPDPESLPLSLPQQFSTNDGSITGLQDGMNNQFTVVTDYLVCDLLLAYNGLGMTQGIDYAWGSTLLSSAGPWVTALTMRSGQNPNVGDVLTAEVFFQ